MTAIYDTIGIGYSGLRRPDPRIASAINSALGDAKTVLNVGAGTGSYEPTGRAVTALEPSAEMIRQRPPGSAKAHQGIAENLPFADNAFNAAMASLTVHHWTDLEAGLLEMRRVAKKRLVIFTFDPDCTYFWLADYIPEIKELDQPTMPKLSEYKRILGKTNVSAVPIPHDCVDGFLGAYWRRPRAYLQPEVRSAISTFSKFGDFSDALKRLESDLESGVWAERYAHMLVAETLDVGYRLVVADYS
ncbi:MAG: class I SAM-dependent methyltransferase [Hyphomonadaceae bacterium]